MCTMTTSTFVPHKAPSRLLQIGPQEPEARKMCGSHWLQNETGTWKACERNPKRLVWEAKNLSSWVLCSGPNSRESEEQWSSWPVVWGHQARCFLHSKCFGCLFFLAGTGVSWIQCFPLLWYGHISYMYIPWNTAFQKLTAVRSYTLTAITLLYWQLLDIHCENILKKLLHETIAIVLIHVLLLWSSPIWGPAHIYGESIW